MKVEVSIETSGNGSMDPQQVMKKLAQLLGTELPTDYQIETPPQTPSPAEQKPDVADGARAVKIEDSRPCAPRTCRNCDRSIEQAVIQETMSRLGLTPPDEVSEAWLNFQHLNDFRKTPRSRSAPRAATTSSWLRAISRCPSNTSTRQSSTLTLIPWRSCNKSARKVSRSGSIKDG